MDLLPPYTTSPAVGSEPAVGGEPVVAGQPAGDAPAVGATSFYPQAEPAPDSTPHQGVGGEPAVGGEPPVAVNPDVGVIIPPWDPEYSKEDVAALRKYPEWWDLVSWVKESLQVNPRRTLSAHTTSVCQPKKATGPSAASLKTCGLDTFLPVIGGQPGPAVGGQPSPAVGRQPAGGGQPAQPAVGGNMMYLQIDLPHAFVHGDLLGVRYVSGQCNDQKVFQEQSCLELLCYLVVSAPARVRLHPSCFIRGEQKVQEFRMKAAEFGNSIGFDERSLAWQVPEVHVGQPLVATVNIGNAESPVPPSCWEPPAVGSTGGHAAVLDALRGLHTNKVYLTSKSKIPMDVARQLKDLLPKGGLLPFLQQYPNLFEVTLTGQYNRKNKPMFTFKVHANIDDELLLAAPAVGGGSSTGGGSPGFGGGASSGASRSGPAVGGGGARRHGKLFAPGIGGTAPTTPPPKHPPPGLPPPVAVAEHQHKEHQLLAVQQAAPAPAGAAPVVFPSGIPVGPASSWSINDMVTYLDAIALGHLNPLIRENGLDGVFFLQCEQEDLQAIGIGQVQRKKIRMYMPQ